MLQFMGFCLSILTELVDMLFNFDVGGYTYGDFVVVTLLVSTLVGSLVIRFRQPSAPPSVPRSSGNRFDGGSD